MTIKEDEIEEFGRKCFYEGREIDRYDGRGRAIFKNPTYEGYLRLLDIKSNEHPKPDNILRYFVDKRSGCAAVRDRLHPKYDPTYPGLHHDTPDVVHYKHGYIDNNQWNMTEAAMLLLNDFCDELNEKWNLNK